MYQGLHCTCKQCAKLTDEERQEKYLRIQAARRRGGKTRSQQESMADARSAGFRSTIEKYPSAASWLMNRMKAQDHARAQQLGISYQQLRQQIKCNAAASDTAYLENLNREFNRTNTNASVPLPTGSLWYS